MKIQRIIDRAKDLPAPSPVLARIMDMVTDPESDTQQMVQVLKQDGIITAKLLSLCNSAAFGLSSTVFSIDQAILYLGQQEIMRLVLALCFGQYLDKRLPNYRIAPDELWWHALVTAQASEEVARSGKGIGTTTSAAYTAGLLHDLGKTVFHEFLDGALQESIRNLVQTEQRSLCEAERCVLQTDHAEVGAALLDHWNLPGLIVEAVRHHHQPVFEPEPLLSSVVHIGDLIAHQIEAAPVPFRLTMRTSQQASDALGLTEEDLDNLISQTHDSMDRMGKILRAA